MKSLREEYIIDSFVDFAGATRKFVIAAISEDIQDAFIDEESYGVEITKRLVLGISVCDPKDEFNEDLGKKIAKGRALSDKVRCSALYSTDKGVINTKVVRALLEQEAEYMKQNPGKYIKSYNKDREDYEYTQKMVGLYATMNESDRRVVSSLKGRTPEEVWNIIRVSTELSKKCK